MAQDGSRWEADNEISGCKNVSRMIIDDDVQFAMFSRPRVVVLKTEENSQRNPKGKRTVTEEVNVDFVYNMRMSDGMNSIGWEGAGFLDGKLQYTGFTSYNKLGGNICAEQHDFLGKSIEDVSALQKAIKVYYVRK